MFRRGAAGQRRSTLWWFVTANGISSIGDWVYLTAVPILVYQRTGDPAAVGLVEIARLAPFLLLSIPAGVIADRAPKVPALLATQAVRLGSMLVLAVLTLLSAPLLAITLVAVVAAIAGTIAMPIERSLIPELAVDDAEIAGANARTAVFDGVAVVIGPSVAGALILAGGLAGAFVVNGVTFVVVIAALASVSRAHRAQRIDKPGQGAEQRTTRFAWTRLARRLAPSLAIDAAVSFASGAMTVLAVILAIDLLHGDEALVAGINVAAGAGGIAGGAVAGRAASQRFDRAIVLLLATSCSALGLLAYVHEPAIAMVAVGVAAGALIALDALNTTAIQQAAHEGDLGRAFGLIQSGSAVSMILGCLAPAAVASVMGPGMAMTATALVVAAVGGAGLLVGRGGGRFARLRMRPAPA